MKIVYSRFAGQSLDRLAALFDGIFAVAMTLLVLDLRTPVADAAIEVCSAIERRIVFYQILYAVAVLLCVVSTYISILLLILMQLNSAIAPRIGWLDSF